MPDTMTCFWVEAKHGETWRNTNVTINAVVSRVSWLFQDNFANRVKALAGLLFLLAEERTFLRQVT
jgi:hypothetical protein